MRKLIAVLVALTFLVALGGCSDDDDPDESKESTTTVEETTTTTETPALDPDEIDTTASPYCATWAEIRGAGAPGTGVEAIKEHYGDLIPTVEKLLGQAPSKIKQSVQVALDATRTVAASGSLDDYQRSEVQDAQRKLSDYAAANCKKT